MKRVLTEPPASLAGFIAGQAAFQNPPTEMMFAITAFSSNQHELTPNALEPSSTKRFRTSNFPNAK